MSIFNDAFFKEVGFIKQDDGSYSKTITAQRVKVNDITYVKEETLKFKVYDYDPMLGTNIEFYVDNNLKLSGYWHDKADFATTF